MNSNDDSFAWAQQLGCPSSTCSNSVKKSLSKGVAGLMWDQVADKLHPTSEVLEARKNILLYKLNENLEDNSIDVVKKISKLKVEREELQKRIIAAEKQREKQEFSIRQKRQQLLKIKSARQTLKGKKEIFSMKHDQMRAQVQDCNQMRQVCQVLMPCVGDQLDQETIAESLILVSSLRSGGNKKQVLKKISEVLHPIAVPLLWNILLQNRMADTERVIQLGSEIPANTTSGYCGEKLEIGIAKACSLHVAAVSKRLLYDQRANVRQQNVMEYIEKIEKSQVNDLDISEWLELTLEVRKWEAEFNGLQKEIDEMNNTLEIRTKLNTELGNIATAVQGIDVQIEECAQDIQTSIALLKGAGTALNCVKEKLSMGLQKFSTLRSSDHDKKWLDVDLSIELKNFYDRIDINALRKITLGGDIGEYRHATNCISQSQLSISVPLDLDSVRMFPFVRAPLHQLLDCYKALIKSAWIASEKPYSLSTEIQLDSLTEVEDKWSLMLTKNNVRTIEDLLALVDQVFGKTQEELQQFDAIYEAWSNQIVKSVLMSGNYTVDGITFEEWQKRFNFMASALASKKKALKK